MTHVQVFFRIHFLSKATFERKLSSVSLALVSPLQIMGDWSLYPVVIHARASDCVRVLPGFPSHRPLNNVLSTDSASSGGLRAL